MRMRGPTWRRSFAIILVGMVLTASACADASDEGSGESGGGDSITDVSLRLDFSWVPDHIPYLWALEKGYYEDEGLNVEILQGQGSGSTMTLVGSGRNEFGWGDLGTAALQISKDVPIEVVAVLTRRTPFGTECFKEVGFEEPQDLVGHSVVLIPQESVAQLWPAYLNANGVDPSDVRVVSATFANKFTLFAQGRADCMADYFGIGLDIARAINPNIGEPIAWEEHGIHVLSQGLVVNDGFAESDPDAVRSFVSASIKGWEDVCADVDAAIDFYGEQHPELNEKSSDRELNRIRLDYECDSTEPLPETAATQFGPSTDEEWQPMLDLLSEYGGLEDEQSPDAYYTNEFLPE
jgi:NitT/TauT family transport system substrate-binding protein